jgi:hypothetical protein
MQAYPALIFRARRQGEGFNLVACHQVEGAAAKPTACETRSSQMQMSILMKKPSYSLGLYLSIDSFLKRERKFKLNFTH